MSPARKVSHCQNTSLGIVGKSSVITFASSGAGSTVSANVDVDVVLHFPTHIWFATLESWLHTTSIPKSFNSKGALFSRRRLRCCWTGLPDPLRRRHMQCPAPPAPQPLRRQRLARSASRQRGDLSAPPDPWRQRLTRRPAAKLPPPLLECRLGQPFEELWSDL